MLYQKIVLYITSKQSTNLEIIGKQSTIFWHNNLLDDKKKRTGCYLPQQASRLVITAYTSIYFFHPDYKYVLGANDILIKKLPLIVDCWRMIFSLMQFHKNFTIVGISKTILKGGSLYLLHYFGFDWCVWHSTLDDVIHRKVV